MIHKNSISFMQMKVWRVKSGIILAEPNVLLPSSIGFPAVYTGAAVSDFMRMPISFWLLDTEGATKAINPEGIEVCGFRSEKHALGRSLLDVSHKESAIHLIGNCQEVIRVDAFRIFEESNFRKDDVQQQFLSIKLPWYDVDQNVIGVCGFSIVLGRHSLAGSLSILAGYGIPGEVLNPVAAPVSSLPDVLQQLSLPPREQQCLQLTVQGYTAKMIARKLGLSYRTIESYLVNLKTRLGVSSRNELIQIAHGLSV